MNQRIRNIEGLAREQVRRTDGLVRTDDFLQKFAELIVKECLTFVEPMPGSGDIDDLALEGARDAIKEHFGIEE